MKRIEYLILFCVIFIIAKTSLAWSRYYPDSAVVIGKSYYDFATGEVGGNRVSIRDNKGWIHVVYSTGWGCNYADSTEIYYVFSINNGIDWSGPINVSRTDSACSVEPSLTVDSENHLHCVWKQFVTDTTIPTQGYYDLFYSNYNGIIWSEPLNISNLHSVSNTGDYSSLVIDSNDNPHVVFDVPNAKGDWDIFYISYNGTTWSEPYNISNDNYDSAFPCLTIDSGDTLHLVWRKRITNRPVMYSKYDGISWSTPRVISDSLMGSVPCIITDSQDRIHVIFGGGEIYYTTCEDGLWSYPVNISNTDSGSYGANISCDKFDNLYVVWEEKVDIFYDIYYIIFDGCSWTEVVNLTQDTVHSISAKLGYPVSPNGVDLVWTSDPSRNTLNIIYMKLALIQQTIEDEQNMKSRVKLLQTEPNPFSCFTDIRYQMIDTESGLFSVQIKVYDITGREVIELLNSYQPIGEHSVRWEGRDSQGRKAISGVYFVRLQVGEFYDVNRLLLVKK